MRRSAHQEAVGHFTAARELLATLPETPERVQQELEVQIALRSHNGPCLITDIAGVRVSFHTPS